MKKISLIVSCALLPLCALELRFIKTFENRVLPETLSVQLSVSTIAPNEKEALAVLGKYSTVATKKLDGLEVEGGQYSIYPNYEYVENRQILKGYQGAISYTAKSKNKEQIDGFMTRLLEIKKPEQTSVSVGEISWTVGETRTREELDALRDSALTWGVGYASKISKDLSKECTLHSIDIGGNTIPTPIVNYPQVKAVAADVSFAAAPAPVPEQTSSAISITPSFLVECK